MLILSQVILSLQLGFAIIPLLHFVSDKRRMGEFVIGKWAKTAGWLSASIIIALNINLVYSQVGEWLGLGGTVTQVTTFLVIPLLLFSGFMLGYIFAKPLITKRLQATHETTVHGNIASLASLGQVDYKEIAIALDFSSADAKTIQHALFVGGKSAKYFLIHTVETVGAFVLQSETSDLESSADKQQLQLYISNLEALGYNCEAILGYGSPKIALPKLVKEKGVDLLVMGAHGHNTFKDLIFGATANAVRHSVEIPVLIVR
jgi:manganese transport protein